MSSRLPALDAADYTPAQQAAAVQFAEARQRPVFGPFACMLHSPVMMSCAARTGEYLRYNSAIGTALSELVILVTARHWTQDYEWYVHAPEAAREGIADAIIDAIRCGAQPRAMSDDQEAVYEFAHELLHNKCVSDATFARVEQRFGKAGCVDLSGLCGYYSLLAMQLNVAQLQLPAGGVPLPRLP